MLNPRDIFLQELQPKFDNKADKYPPFRAVLTSSIGATDTGSVWKNENARLVWFRAWGAGSVNWALCDVLEPVLGLGVIIQFNPNINQFRVVEDDPFLRNENSDAASFRAVTHIDFLKGGRFQLWLDPTMFIPISVYPTGASTVNVTSGDYLYQNERKTFAGSIDKDLSGNRPAAGQHRLVGLYLDNANTLQTVNGTAVSTAVTASDPTWPAGAFRVAVVDLDNATAISINDIDNRKVIYTGDDGLLSGAWPNDQKAMIGTIEYDTITAADTAAGATDVIKAGGGTFAEQVDLTNATYLIGTGQGTIIQDSTSPSLTISKANAVVQNLTAASNVAGTATALDNNAASNLYNIYLHAYGAGTNYAIDASDSVVAHSCRVLAAGGTTNYAFRQTAATDPSILYDCDLEGDILCTGGTIFLIGCRVDGDITCNDISGAIYIIGCQVTGDVTETIGVIQFFGSPNVSGTVTVSGNGGSYQNDTGVLLPLSGIDLDGLADGLILDSDGDTTISAPTDDQIDFEVNSTDVWRINPLGGFLGQVVTTIVQSKFPLDQRQFNTPGDSVVSHFRDYTATYPAAWTEVDAPNFTSTQTIYSFWHIRGTNAETSWKYRIQADSDFEGDLDTFPDFVWGPIYFRDGSFTADVDYYFWICRDNGGIDEDTFSRVHLHWDSGTSVWQVRCQVKDVTSGTTNSSAYTTLLNPLIQPIYLAVQVSNTTKVATARIMNTFYVLEGLTTDIGSATPTNVLDYNQFWVQMSMSRGAGILDDIFIGGFDIV